MTEYGIQWTDGTYLRGQFTFTWTKKQSKADRMTHLVAEDMMKSHPAWGSDAKIVALKQTTKSRLAAAEMRIAELEADLQQHEAFCIALAPSVDCLMVDCEGGQRIADLIKQLKRPRDKQDCPY